MNVVSTLVGQQRKLSDETFRQLRDYIYSLSGIYFQDNKKYLLEGRLGKRLQIIGMDSFENYFQYVRSDKAGKQELTFLFDAITINETFFFRNQAQFDAFERSIVPELISQGKSKLRIWSAASSSGEEAYTLAMIYLEKLKPRYPQLTLEIVGTDISPSVIEIARRGIYREYSVRNTPRQYLDKYFAFKEGRFQIDEQVKRLVRFDVQNLYDSAQMRLMRNFDVIFCCNVLIYFDVRSKIQVVAHLYNSLNKNGYLFIGYAESLHGISTAFTLVNFPKTVAYKKE